MKEQTTFVLRKIGSSSFVRHLPHDFDMERNFVDGWENLPERALSWESHKKALEAKLADPDGDSLMVEEV